MAVKVEGVERLNRRLNGLARKHRGTRMTVGFSAQYAIYVHENLKARHKVGKAKFLEEPARLMASELGQIAAAAVRAGASFAEACLRAGRRLLEASQAITPVDTGFLRQSGFVRVDQ